MKTAGYNLTVIGASSLLGKELLAVLEERNFPVADLITVSGAAGEPDLPIVDLSRRRAQSDYQEDIPTDFDFAFVATPHPDLASWIERAGGERPGSKGSRAVIDLCCSLPQAEPAAVRVPFLDGPSATAQEHEAGKASRTIASPHAATLVIAALLSRLSARFHVQNSVAQILAQLLKWARALLTNSRSRQSTS